MDIDSNRSPSISCVWVFGWKNRLPAWNLRKRGNQDVRYQELGEIALDCVKEARDAQSSQGLFLLSVSLVLLFCSNIFSGGRFTSPSIMTGTTCHQAGAEAPWWQMVIFISAVFYKAGCSCRLWFCNQLLHSCLKTTQIRKSSDTEHPSTRCRSIFFTE